jgi:hypothetical protein
MCIFPVTVNPLNRKQSNSESAVSIQIARPTSILEMETKSDVPDRAPDKSVDGQSMTTGHIVYILVQGTTDFASQRHSADLLRLMWILYLGGVNAADVTVFIAGQACALPLRGPGLNPFEFPVEFWSQAITDRLDLADSVAGHVALAISRNDVSGVVLVYLGDAQESALGEGTERVTVNNVCFWARLCAFTHRTFLGVFAGKCSTVFAETVWRVLTNCPRQEGAQLLSDYVGFITSSRDVYASSTPVVSRYLGVVELFGEFAGPLPGGFLPGFYIRGSMFCRQLNRLLAYGFGCSATTTVSDFVRLLNPRNVEQQGFWAEYVGGPGASLLPLSAFFPVGTQQPTSEIHKGLPVQVKDLIAAEELGELVDDPDFNLAKPGDKSWFCRQLIEAQRCGFTPEQPGTRINIEDIVGHPLLERLPGKCSEDRSALAETGLPGGSV